MLLRHVIEHVREQNWTAVWTAVWIDFVIVLVGQFFGIQVSNWNASRREAQRALGYLTRIHRDLSMDIDPPERRVRLAGLTLIRRGCFAGGGNLQRAEAVTLTSIMTS